MKQILLLAGAVALGIAGPAVAKPGHGHGNPHAYGYGTGGCPPGLAKKAIPCVPPGQAKKLYNVGQRFPLGYGSPLGYNQIPYDLRSQYGLRSLRQLLLWRRLSLSRRSEDDADPAGRRRASALSADRNGRPSPAAFEYARRRRASGSAKQGVDAWPNSRFPRTAWSTSAAATGSPRTANGSGPSKSTATTPTPAPTRASTATPSTSTNAGRWSSTR